MPHRDKFVDHKTRQANRAQTMFNDSLSPGMPTGDNMYRYASRISDTWLADNADNWTGLNVLFA